MLLVAPTMGGAQSRAPFQFARTVLWGADYPAGSGQAASTSFCGCDSRGRLSAVIGRPVPNGFWGHWDVYEDGVLMLSTLQGQPPEFNGASIGWVEPFAPQAATPSLIVGRYGDPLTGIEAGCFAIQGGRIILRSRQPLASPSFANWVHYWLPGNVHASKSPERFYVRSLIRDLSSTATRFGILKVTHDGQGQVLDERFVIEFGQILPGQSHARAINVSLFSVTPDGRLIAKVETDVLGTVLWFDGTVVLSTGDPTNIPGRTIESIWNPDANGQGDWAASVRLDGGERAVVKNGAVQWRGGAPPFDTGGRPIIHLERLSLAEDGRVFVLAKNDNPMLQFAAWLVVDGQPIYTPYRDRYQGERVFGPTGGATRLTDPEGAFITFRSGLLDSQQQGTFFAPLVRSRVVCAGPASSSGEAPTIEYLGSTWVDSDERHLVGRGLPLGSAVVWLRSMQQASTPLPGAGQGTLCLGAPIARLAAPVEASGDSIAPRAFFGFAGRQYFQIWYRDHDPLSGAPTVRVTDAVVVDLQ